MRRTRGQSTLEYAFLLAIIIAAIIGMQIYVRRGMMGRLRDTADQQLGSQFDPYKTKGKVSHVAGGTTTDELKIDGTSSSSFNATQTDKYVSDEVVTPYTKAETDTGLF